MNGRFFDGESASAQSVTVEVDSDSIVIASRDSTNVTERTFSKSSSLPQLRLDGSYEILLDKVARVVLTGKNVESWMRENNLRIRSRTTVPRRWSLTSLAALSLFSVSFIALLLWSVPQCAVVFVPLIPISAEEEIGEHMHKSIVKNLKGECSNREAQVAVQRFVNRLLKESGSRRKVRVTLVNSPTLNAFAVPGGNIYVLRGIIKAASSGNELAAVIAHELGHVTKRHILKSLTQQIGLRVVATYLSAGLDTIGDASLFLSSHLIGFSYSRGNESEADLVGMEFLKDAGIDSRGAASFFTHIKEKLGDPTNGIGGYLATHPSHTERIEALLPIETSGKDAFTVEEWRVIKSECG
jgi:Zn-dependent protease with chaperone function